MKCCSQMSQPGIVPDEEVHMRQAPGYGEEIYSLKHQWRLLANPA